eukprot:TRINITY_DN1786_c0_g1_i2.p1 TRINITY_DN1786_c0_g1~~TRINITY_DN1786_c0_g1_i2.p1  ORF type:complete len:268 (-),score=30.80 TRINITY_DN1786_c0_g1_i2:392-1195(-)
MEKPNKLARAAVLISELSNQTEQAPLAISELAKLSRTQELADALPILLWHSFGSISILLLETIRASNVLKSSKKVDSERLTNTLQLFQCLANNPKTRMNVIKARIHLYLLPFLDCFDDLEIIQKDTLNVFASLISGSETYEVVESLIQTDLTPRLLKIMKSDNRSNILIASLIISRLLQNDYGRAYICKAADRLKDVKLTLDCVVKLVCAKQDVELGNYTIGCYSELVKSPLGCKLMNEDREAIAMLSKERDLHKSSASIHTQLVMM